MLVGRLLEDRHLDLAETLDGFIGAQVRDAEPGDTEDEQSRGLVKTLARAELLALTVPDSLENGGASFDVRALCVVREHLSYESSLADLMFAMQGLGSFPVTLAGSDEIKR